MLFGLLLFLFLLICVILVFLVLIQDDKGGGISGAIGGGIGSTANTLLGSQNAENILTRGTKIFAGLFFALTLIITLLVSKGNITGRASSGGLRDHVSGISDVTLPQPTFDGSIMPYNATRDMGITEEMMPADFEIPIEMLLPTEE
jgi:protein translocase SecG subunit